MTDPPTPSTRNIAISLAWFVIVVVSLGIIGNFALEIPTFHWRGFLALSIGYSIGTIASLVLARQTESNTSRWNEHIALIGVGGFAVWIFVVWFNMAGSLALPTNALPYPPLLLFIAFGVTGFMVGLTNGATIQPAGSVMSGIAIALLFALASMLSQTIYNDVVSTLVISGLFGIMAGLALRSIADLRLRLGVGITYGLVLGWVLGVAFSATVGVMFGLLFSVTFVLTHVVLAYQKPPDLNNLAQHSSRLSKKQIATLADELLTQGNNNPDVYARAIANLQKNPQNMQAIPLLLNKVVAAEIQRCDDVFKIATFKDTAAWVPLHLMQYEDAQLLQDIVTISQLTHNALHARTQEEGETGLANAEKAVQALLHRNANNPLVNQEVLRQWMTSLSTPPSDYNEEKQLPLYYLPGYLSRKARYDKDEFFRAVEERTISAHQDWIVPQALSLFVENQAKSCTNSIQIADFHANTQWVNEYLKDEQQIAFLRKLQQVSYQTDEVMNTPLPDVERRASGLGTEIQQIEARCKQLEQRKDGLTSVLEAMEQYSHAHPAANTPQVLGIWDALLRAEQKNLANQITSSAQALDSLRERHARGELPSPYQTGAVLERNSPLFRGREELFTRLKQLLDTADQGVLVLGQPRTGKTSFLQQLPVHMGNNMLPVYFDMHHASTEDTSALITFLVDEIRTQVDTLAVIGELPAFDSDSIKQDPYRAFQAWIAQIDERLQASQCKLLLSLDEFYRLDDAFKKGRLDVNRLLGLFRDLIHNHPDIVIIFCGTVTLQECHPEWIRALRSVNTVKVTYLPPEAARVVFARPVLDFPDNVYSEDAIQRALHLTRGQPMMLHALGRSVIENYNRSRGNAKPDTPRNLPLPVGSIDTAVEEVLNMIDSAFLSIFQWSMDISSEQQDVARSMLQKLARDEPINDVGTEEQRNRLLDLYCERDLLEEKAEHPGGYDYQVPLIKEWVKTKRILP
jgi:hypothetical protein